MPCRSACGSTSTGAARCLTLHVSDAYQHRSGGTLGGTRFNSRLAVRLPRCRRLQRLLRRRPDRGHHLSARAPPGPVRDLSRRSIRRQGQGQECDAGGGRPRPQGPIRREGSIRRGPEHIRVSVSLTDTARSALLWSEKYDTELKDIFGVQDQITRRISGALAVRVTSLELAKSAAKPPSNLEADDLVLRGRDLLSRQTRSANAQARGLLSRQKGGSR